MTKREYDREWRKRNRKRINEYNKKYRQLNNEKVTAYARNYRKFHISKRQLKKYGITEVQFNEMLTKQNSCCSICGKAQEECGRRLDVDHNHVTGKVRELLCGTCNMGMGLFQDNVELLSKVIQYLTKHSTT